MAISHNAELYVADWTGPYGWPGFETYNKLQPLPSTCGVYLQTVEYNGGYLIYAAGHSNNIKNRFKVHEKNRRSGIDTNIFDIDQMKLGVRKLIWNGYSDWWKDNADPKHLLERETALNYPTDWGNDIPYSETRKAIAFGVHWRQVLDASIRQSREFRIFTAAFGPEERLRKRLEAGIMRCLYEAASPYSEIPDKGMALSGRHTAKGEASITVENRSPVLLHALPARLEI